MNTRTTGFASVIGLAVGLTVPTQALADDYRITLSGHTVVPVGPQGPGISVRRKVVQGRRYVAVSAPSASSSSLCNAPMQRVTVWERTEDHGWIESLSDTWEPCVRIGTELVPRSISADVVSASEARVIFSLPHRPQVSDTVVRYARRGDRFVGPHHEHELAAAPDEPSRAELAQVSDGAVDGDLHEWQGITPIVSSHDARVWLGIDGRTLRFAAHLPSDAAPVVSLALAEPGVSTNVMLSSANNHGRLLTVRCDQAVSRDATVSCHQDANGIDLEGSTDLGTMVWSARRITSLAVYAQAGDGSARASSDPELRLHPYALSTPVDLLDRLSAETMATCGHARFHAWVDAGGARVLTCGNTCADGECDHVLPAEAMPRVSLVRDHGGVCAALRGEGSDQAHTCGTDGDPARLIGNFPIDGFTTVVAIERSLGSGGNDARRPEVWALVSPSAGWQQLWRGTDHPASDPFTVDIQGFHPRFCGEHAACQVANVITLSPPDRGPVTASLGLLARTAGLSQPPRF